MPVSERGPVLSLSIHPAIKAKFDLALTSRDTKGYSPLNKPPLVGTVILGLLLGYPIHISIFSDKIGWWRGALKWLPIALAYPVPFCGSTGLSDRSQSVHRTQTQRYRVSGIADRHAEV